jgi:hypothetical protein
MHLGVMREAKGEIEKKARFGSGLKSISKEETWRRQKQV